MKNKNLRLNKELWQNFAREIYDIRNRLLKAEVEYQELLAKSKRQKLIRAREILDDFRSVAVSEMSKLTGEDTFAIWYPGGPQK